MFKFHVLMVLGLCLAVARADITPASRTFVGLASGNKNIALSTGVVQAASLMSPQMTPSLGSKELRVPTDNTTAQFGEINLLTAEGFSDARYFRGHMQLGLRQQPWKYMVEGTLTDYPSPYPSLTTPNMGFAFFDEGAASCRQTNVQTGDLLSSGSAQPSSGCQMSAERPSSPSGNVVFPMIEAYFGSGSSFFNINNGLTYVVAIAPDFIEMRTAFYSSTAPTTGSLFTIPITSGNPLFGAFLATQSGSIADLKTLDITLDVTQKSATTCDMTLTISSTATYTHTETNVACSGIPSISKIGVKYGVPTAAPQAGTISPSTASSNGYSFMVPLVNILQIDAKIIKTDCPQIIIAHGRLTKTTSCKITGWTTFAPTGSAPIALSGSEACNGFSAEGDISPIHALATRASYTTEVASCPVSFTAGGSIPFWFPSTAQFLPICASDDDPNRGGGSYAEQDAITSTTFDADFKYEYPSNTSRFVGNLLAAASDSCTWAPGSGLAAIGLRCSTDGDCVNRNCAESGNTRIGKICSPNECTKSEPSTPGYTPGTFSDLTVPPCNRYDQFRDKDCRISYTWAGYRSLCHPTLGCSVPIAPPPATCISGEPYIISGTETCNRPGANTPNGTCLGYLDLQASCAQCLFSPASYSDTFTPAQITLAPITVKQGDMASGNMAATVSGFQLDNGNTRSYLSFVVHQTPQVMTTPISLTISGTSFELTFPQVKDLFQSPRTAQNDAIVYVYYGGILNGIITIPFEFQKKNFAPTAGTSTPTTLYSWMGRVVSGTVDFGTFNTEPTSSFIFAYGGTETNLTVHRPDPATYLPITKRIEHQIPMGTKFGSLYFDGQGGFEFHPAHEVQTSVTFSYAVRFPGYEADCTGECCDCPATGTVTIVFRTFLCGDTDASGCTDDGRFKASQYLPAAWESEENVWIEWQNNAIWIFSSARQGVHYQRVSSFEEINFDKTNKALLASATSDTTGHLKTAAIPTNRAAFNRNCLIDSMPWLDRFDAKNIDTFCTDFGVSAFDTDDTLWRSNLCTNAPLLSISGAWQMSMSGCNYTIGRKWSWNELRNDTEGNWDIVTVNNTIPTYKATTEFYSEALQPASWYQASRGWWEQNHKYIIQVMITGHVEFSEEFTVYECDLQWSWQAGQDVDMNLDCFCKLHPDAILCTGLSQCEPGLPCEGFPPNCTDIDGNPSLTACNIPPPECRTLFDSNCMCIAEQGSITDPTFENPLQMSIFMCRNDAIGLSNDPSNERGATLCRDKFQETGNQAWLVSRCDKYCGRVQLRFYITPDVFQEIWFFYCYMRTSVNVDGGFVGFLHTCRSNPFVDLQAMTDANYPQLCEMKETTVYSPTDINTILYEIPGVSTDQVQPCEVVADFLHPVTHEWVVLWLRTKEDGIIANTTSAPNTDLLQYTEIPTDKLGSTWDLGSTDFGFSWRPGVLNLNVKIRINTTLCVVSGGSTPQKAHRGRTLAAGTSQTAFTKDIFISQSFDSSSARMGAALSTSSNLGNNYGTRPDRRSTMVENMIYTPASIIVGVIVAGIMAIVFIVGGAFMMGRKMKTGSLWAPRGTSNTRPASEAAIELSHK